MELPRNLAKAYANLNGYFWLRCPYPGCGRMFGGHEAGEYVMGYRDNPSLGSMCCRLHDEDVPYKVFQRTGVWPEQLTMPENCHGELTFEI
jgi:hypothetical protein